MKSERRHELQFNELGQNLSNLLAWAKRNSNYLSWGVLLIAVVFAVSMWLYTSHRNKLAAREMAYNSAMSNDDPQSRLAALRAMADEEGGDRQITAKATLAVGTQCLDQCISGLGKMSKDGLDKSAEEAATYFNKAAANFPEYPAIVVNAHRGLGKVAENKAVLDASKSDAYFAEARKQYEAALVACPEGHALRDIVQKDMDNLTKIRTLVVMATTAPATQPASAPASKPAAESKPATPPEKTPK